MPRVRAPSDAQMQAFYDEHKKSMRTPERIRVSHILIRDNPDASLAERQEIKQDMQTARSRAARGEEFAALAREYSQDETTKDRGGDLGWVQRGELAPEFEEQVFALKKGQVSQIFPSRWGMHIAVITDRKASRSMSFEDAKLEIRARLMQEEAEKEFIRWIEQKKKEYGIRIVLSDERSYALRSGSWTDEATQEVVSEQEISRLLDETLK